MSDISDHQPSAPADAAEAQDKVRDVFELEETVAGWDDDYYHPIAEKYYDEAVPAMLRRMGAGPGDMVLDAGCGPGVHAIRAARYGCTVKAIDLSERMLAHARDRAAQAGVADKIEFQQADLTDLKLESEAYPFVFNWGVVIHVPDTEAALSHLTRIVAPGGKLALHITNEKSLDFRLEQAARGLVRKPLEGLRDTGLGKGVWYDHHGQKLWVLRFDAERLSKDMERRGFKTVDRYAAEYTEFQWRLKGPAKTILRPAILQANRLAYKVGAPASLSCTQIMIFEKCA
ncbi:MAG: class I SAM-dependent methyltransferase [Pseudomonadota bacterium]